MKRPSAAALAIAVAIGVALLWMWPSPAPKRPDVEPSAEPGQSAAPSRSDAELRVHVSAAGGRVPGARVTVEAIGRRPLGFLTAGVTGADGSVSLQPVPFGNWRLRVTHGELAPHERLIEVVAEHVELEVTLARGVRIVGQVLDSRRRPLAGATLRVLSDGSDAEHGRTLSNARGEFVVGGLDVGVYRVYAHAERYRPRYEGPIRFGAHGEEQRVEIMLDEGRVIAGVVVDAERKPVAGARLGAASEGSSIVVSDEQGRFELTGLGTEPVNIYATAVGYGPKHVSGMRPGVRGVEVVLERAASLQGTVALAASTDKMMVSLCRHDERIDDELCVARRLYEPPEASFALDGLPTGTFDVVIEADGHRVARVAVRLLPGQNFTVPLVSLVRAD